MNKRILTRDKHMDIGIPTAFHEKRIVTKKDFLGNKRLAEQRYKIS